MSAVSSPASPVFTIASVDAEAAKLKRELVLQMAQVWQAEYAIRYQVNLLDVALSEPVQPNLDALTATATKANAGFEAIKARVERLAKQVREQKSGDVGANVYAKACDHVHKLEVLCTTIDQYVGGMRGMLGNLTTHTTATVGVASATASASAAAPAATTDATDASGSASVKGGARTPYDTLKLASDDLIKDLRALKTEIQTAANSPDTVGYSVLQRAQNQSNELKRQFTAFKTALQPFQDANRSSNDAALVAQVREFEGSCDTIQSLVSNVSLLLAGLASNVDSSSVPTIDVPSSALTTAAAPAAAPAAARFGGAAARGKGANLTFNAPISFGNLAVFADKSRSLHMEVNAPLKAGNALIYEGDLNGRAGREAVGLWHAAMGLKSTSPAPTAASGAQVEELNTGATPAVSGAQVEELSTGAAPQPQPQPKPKPASNKDEKTGGNTKEGEA